VNSRSYRFRRHFLPAGILALVALAGCRTPAPRPTPPTGRAPPRETWKLTASSMEGERFAARFAADGDPETRWSSEWSDPQWLQVDLGRPVVLCGAVIQWEAAYARRYRIAVSSNAHHWSTVAENPRGDGHTDYLFFSAVTARYVRIVGEERGTGWGYSIWELDLIGADRRPRILSADRRQILPEAASALDGAEGTSWHTPPLPFAFLLDLGSPLPVGGLRLVWGSDYASSGSVSCSGDGRHWTEAGRFDGGKGRFEVVMFPARTTRFFRIDLECPAGHPAEIKEITLRGPDEDLSPMALYAVAAEKAPELYPAYLRGVQTFWTAVGAPAAPEEALLDEFGAVEPRHGAPALYPFLLQEGRVVAPAGTRLRHALAGGWCPLPCVEAVTGKLRLRVSLLPWQPGTNSLAAARYEIANRAACIVTGRLVLVVRPLQINPPWQHGGWAPITSLRLERRKGSGVITVNGSPYAILLSPWQAARLDSFHNGDVAENLSCITATAPVLQSTNREGNLSAAVAYDFRLEPMEKFTLAALFPARGERIAPAALLALPDGRVLSPADAFHELERSQTKQWRDLLRGFSLSLPFPEALLAARAQAGYLLVNQDGPALQPGPRNYNRSWIRDGSLMAATLLRMGITNPVRRFIRWYTARVQPDGWVPPILNSDGSINHGFGWDKEYDSQGEYCFLVMEYYRFTRDRTLLAECYPAMRRAAHYLEKLLARTRSPDYMRGSRHPERFRGILPPSISHEGYSTPAHSYWDDFWALRGLKDFRAAAEIMDDPDEAAWAGAQYRMLRHDLSNSVAATMRTAGLDYVPASADHADFDPTSVAIAFFPCAEDSLLPSQAVARLFGRYARGLEDRLRPGWKGSYTPYEARNINALCLLGMREHALRLLRFLLAGRHPPEWNAFAEVVHGDPRRGAYIGDLPHTWVGAAFAAAVRNLLAMEHGERLVLLAGVPPRWLQSPDGVSARDLPTHFGPLTLQAHLEGYTLKVVFSGRLHPPGGVVLCWPVRKPSQVIVDGREWTAYDEQRCYLPETPHELTAYW